MILNDIVNSACNFAGFTDSTEILDDITYGSSGNNLTGEHGNALYGISIAT